MHTTWKNKLSQDESKLWQKLLGKETLESIIDRCEFPEMTPVDDSMMALFLMHFGNTGIRYTSHWLNQHCFYRFYEPVLGIALKRLEQCCEGWMAFDTDIREKFIKLLFSRLENVCVRTLVSDMREKKEAGKLSGDTPEQEYEDYVVSFLGSGEYCQSLLKKYPVLAQIMWGMIEDFRSFITDFCCHINEDISLLSGKFWDGNKPDKVTDVQPGMSDAHRGGRSVVKVTWDHKYTLYYKPRTVKNDVVYQDLYQWIGNACGEHIKSYEVIDMENHGWCMPVIPKDCENSTEISAYFRKLGIQLFICYLFYVKDLHFENIMACGEDPVFVDMETFPGLPVFKTVNDFYQKAKAKISDSVMITGALPVTVWNFDGHGIRMGALGNEGKQKLPVKVPVIIRGKTSEMEVVLRHPQLEVKGNLPTIQGKTVYPSDYVEPLIEGFHRGYLFVMEHKQELLRRSKKVFQLNSRVLLRNTQQYFMYLQTASSPFFMTAPWRQRLFFMNLYNSSYVAEKWKDRVIGYESEAMFQRDIPYFYINGSSDSLFDSFDNEYEHYYPLSPENAFEKRLKAMDLKDCGFQERLIRLSMATLPEATKRLINTWAKKPALWQSDGSDADPVNLELSSAYMDGAVKIGKTLMDFAVTDPGEKAVLWPSLNYYGLDEMNWRLDIQNMYLYDGLAGTGLFLSVLAHQTRDMEFIRIFRWVREQLFDYTDTVFKKGCKKDSPVGIFNGEASLIYVYLIWYRLFKDPLYLIYAQKHSEVVEKFYKDDTKLDILSGTAGLIVAWLHLYDITRERRYLELALDGGNRLADCALVQPSGKGWLAAGEKQPLAGMSHGNSGFMVAFARLYARTGNRKFADLLRQLLGYEDGLFNPLTGNWRDLRQMPQDRDNPQTQENGQVKDNGNDAVAWCHGAPGILLARLEMCHSCPDLETQQVAADILRAVKKLAGNIYREGFCLCHGNCGNAWMAMTGIRVLKQAAISDDAVGEWASDKGNIQSFSKTVFMDMIKRMNTGELLPQEKYNPGFMTGISGMGYALLREIYPKLPDVLALKLD